MDPDLNRYDVEHVCSTHFKDEQERVAGHLPRGLVALLHPKHMKILLRRARPLAFRSAISQGISSRFDDDALKVHPQADPAVHRRASVRALSQLRAGPAFRARSLALLARLAGSTL